MTTSLRAIFIGRGSAHIASLALLFILVLIWLSFIGSALAFSAISAGQVTVPQELGVVQSRADGAAGQPFLFVIGEEHVSIKVQQAVADLLRYLSGAYDVRVVCTEGYDRPVVIPREGTSLVAQRFIARADLTARRVSGVEYVARAYPEVSVIGVEDMTAYQAHGKQLDKQGGLEQQAKQWDADFRKFLSQDLGNLRVKAEDVKRFEGALKKLVEGKDFGPLTKSIYDVFGRESAVGRKVTALNERREALERTAQAATTESPESGARDEAMITATLRTLKDKEVVVGVLVVGKLHLAGVERLLGARKVPYVTIVPVGVDERVREGPGEEDVRIYGQWRQGKGTGLEAWLTRFKPQPAAGRAVFLDRTALLGILATADRLRRQGMSENEVLAVIKPSSLPNGVSVDRLFDITGGEGIEFTANGRKGYAYFAGKADQVKAPTGPEPVELGEGGGRYYAVYGSGNSRPPIPPRGSSGEGGDSNLPPDGFERSYFAGVAEQHRQQPERVTIRFAVEGGSLVRWVDDGRKAALNVTPSEVEDLRKRYEKARLGPDMLFAAQKLADALLVELNVQFPEGRRELVQISENDLIGKISLPLVHELAGNEDANRLKSIDKTRVYTIPWKSAQHEVRRLGYQIKDETLADKSRAMEVIQKETEGKALKDVASKILNEAMKSKLTPAVEMIARATPYASI